MSLSLNIDALETASEINAEPHVNISLSDFFAVGAASRFSRNETIFAEGDDADYTYKVVKGAVRLCRLLPDGRRQIADFALPGSLIGFEWGSHYTVSAEAMTHTVVQRFPRRRVQSLCTTTPRFGQALMEFLCKGLSSARDHIVVLGRQTAMERVASFLILLAERQDTGEDGESLMLPMGRQDIGDYLGLTIETVCRSLSELKRRGIISIPNTHSLVLKNVEALRLLADCDE